MLTQRGKLTFGGEEIKIGGGGVYWGEFFQVGGMSEFWAGGGGTPPVGKTLDLPFIVCMIFFDGFCRWSIHN